MAYKYGKYSKKVSELVMKCHDDIVSFLRENIGMSKTIDFNTIAKPIRHAYPDTGNDVLIKPFIITSIRISPNYFDTFEYRINTDDKYVHENNFTIVNKEDEKLWIWSDWNQEHFPTDIFKIYDVLVGYKKELLSNVK